MMENLSQFVVVALLIEALVETLKPLYRREAGAVDRLVALGLAVPVCALAGVDIFAAVGVNLNVPYLGAVLTGVVLSRGANVIHDLVKLISERRHGVDPA